MGIRQSETYGSIDLRKGDAIPGEDRLAGDFIKQGKQDDREAK